MLVAVIGLTTFALALALIEQFVLELIEANVKKGSQVYENGHVSAPALEGCTVNRLDVPVAARTPTSRLPSPAVAVVAVGCRRPLQYLVLGWCRSQRDWEMVIRIASSITQAYKNGERLVTGAYDCVLSDLVPAPTGPCRQRDKRLPLGGRGRVGGLPRRLGHPP